MIAIVGCSMRPISLKKRDIQSCIWRLLTARSGLVRPITSQMSAFGKHVMQLAAARDLSIFEVGVRARIKGRSRMLYAMRPRSGKARSAALSVQELVSIGKVLHLPAEDMAEFVLLGLLENTPAEVRHAFDHLRKVNLVLVREQGKEPTKITMDDLGHRG